MRKSLVASLCLGIVLAACHGRGRPGTGDERGTRSGPDAGPTPAAPGEVRLEVGGFAWGPLDSFEGRQPLIVQVALSNGASADPAPLAPERFSAQTSGGAEVLGTGESWLGEPCSADLAVAAGASRTCFVEFRLPVGETPTAVLYRAPDGREARATIAACSASSPEGLCGPDQLCMDGACTAQCSAEHPDGPCADGWLCRSGECIPRCSPEHPEGACESGGCVDGACDASCTTFDTAAEDCVSCASALYDTGACGSDSTAGCASPDGCALCPFGEGNTCGCAESADCAGCEAEARAGWDCVARECPSCVR